jgi:cell division protein FtsW
MAVSRLDTSVLGRWWWTVDRVTLYAVMLLMLLGYVAMLAVAPMAARRMGLDPSAFVGKQVLFLALAAVVLVAISLLQRRQVLLLAMVGTAGAFLATILAWKTGPEINGAHRWIRLGGLQLQPSEFLKPCFAVTAAWFLAEANRRAALAAGFPGRWTGLQSRLLYTGLPLLMLAAFALVLKAQPDIGMLLVMVAVFLAQLFVAGIHWALVAAMPPAAMLGGVGLYLTMPHFRDRFDRWWHGAPQPGGRDNYQVDRAAEAFGNGGLLGRGPGEGTVKAVLPDPHTDFVFAVTGEEFGLVLCALILALFCFVVVRGLLRLLAEQEPVVVLAATGLLAQFGLQAFINMASSLQLIPAKGMTLPFISYGGSSALAIALGMGMLLALTRRRASRADGLA